MKEYIEKFNKGEPLTDVECRHLHRFFGEMEDGCDILGSEYNLFKYEMRKYRLTVEQFLKNRGINVR